MKTKLSCAALVAAVFSLSACAPPSDTAEAEATAAQQAEELAKAQEELVKAQEEAAKAQEEAAKAEAELEAAKKRAASKPAAATSSAQAAPSPPPPPPVCSNCGTVASIDEVRVKGDGSGLGAVAGAIAGGVIGHQFGGGKGKDVATGVGAVAGGVAGHQIERSVKAQTYYNIGVRMDNGGYQTVRVASPAGLTVGTPVRVVGNDIQLR